MTLNDLLIALLEPIHAWYRLKKRLGITGLTFHDLRHEAISRMFEEGKNITQVIAISGHQTVS